MTPANHELPTLITANSDAGLKLAGELAERLHIQLDPAHYGPERPGGMNYRLPVPVPKETIASILFYAIAAANRGWGPQR